MRNQNKDPEFRQTNPNNIKKGQNLTKI